MKDLDLTVNPNNPNKNISQSSRSHLRKTIAGYELFKKKVNGQKMKEKEENPP